MQQATLATLDFLDFRTLLPLDYEAIHASVVWIGRLLILHEDTVTGGIGGEIAVWVDENCSEILDIHRLCVALR